MDRHREDTTHRRPRAGCHRLHLHFLLLLQHPILAGCLDGEEHAEENNHEVKTAEKRREKNKQVKVCDLRLREEDLVLSRP